MQNSVECDFKERCLGCPVTEWNDRVLDECPLATAADVINLAWTMSMEEAKTQIENLDGVKISGFGKSKLTDAGDIMHGAHITVECTPPGIQPWQFAGKLVVWQVGKGARDFLKNQISDQTVENPQRYLRHFPDLT